MKKGFVIAGLGAATAFVAVAGMLTSNKPPVTTTVFVPQGVNAQTLAADGYTLIPVKGNALAFKQARPVIDIALKNGNPEVISAVVVIEGQTSTDVAAVVATGGSDAAQRAVLAATSMSNQIKNSQVITGIEKGNLSYDQAYVALGYQKNTKGQYVIYSLPAFPTLSGSATPSFAQPKVGS